MSNWGTNKERMCFTPLNNLDENRPCPAVCIINGCECPAGTVIDEDKGECVAPSECEGTHIGMFWLC